MPPTIDVLLCYRGRFQPYVRALVQALRALGLGVAYDREILDGPSAASAGSAGSKASATLAASTEVDWVTLGDAPQHDVAWRAPLRAAVDAAELVAFALDWRDPGVNVTNEIRWAIQSQAHSFFLIHAGPVDPESRGVVVGVLATHYLLTTGQPDYPEFGVHFCADLDQGDLAAEATIAAHRIAAHRARCREGALHRLSADNDLKLPDLGQLPEPRARRLLRALQAAAAGGNAPEALAARGSAMQMASQYLKDKELAAAQDGASAGQIDQFRRADELLARCQPGPHEIPGYIGPLLLQAAAIEAVLQSDLRLARPEALDFHPRVFIGTVPGTDLVQPWAAVPRDDFRLLVIDAAFIDFLYQLIKLTVSTAAAHEAEQDGRRGVRLDFAALPQQLDAQPALLASLHRCLRRYVAEGLPDATLALPPEPVYEAALALTLRQAKRQLLAHGYAALTLQGAPWPMPALHAAPLPPDTPEARQALLDLLALDYGVRAGRAVDDGNAAQALIGALLLHSAVHIRQRMLATLAPASEKWQIEPPQRLVERLQRLMTHVGRRMAEGGAPDDWIQQQLRQAWLTGSTPLHLWARVEPLLRNEGAAGLVAMPAWG